MARAALICATFSSVSLEARLGSLGAGAAPVGDVVDPSSRAVLGWMARAIASPGALGALLTALAPPRARPWAGLPRPGCPLDS